jgi:hypothetical protein
MTLLLLANRHVERYFAFCEGPHRFFPMYYVPQYKMCFSCGLFQFKTGGEVMKILK